MSQQSKSAAEYVSGQFLNPTWPGADPPDAGFRKDVERIINRYSQENGNDTPDFILAEYLTDCLATFDKAVKRRAQWYGRHDSPGQPSSNNPLESAKK